MINGKTEKVLITRVDSKDPHLGEILKMIKRFEHAVVKNARVMEKAICISSSQDLSLISNTQLLLIRENGRFLI